MLFVAEHSVGTGSGGLPQPPYSMVLGYVTTEGVELLIVSFRLLCSPPLSLLEGG
jgi:hypothetical protein